MLVVPRIDAAAPKGVRGFFLLSPARLSPWSGFWKMARAWASAAALKSARNCSADWISPDDLIDALSRRPPVCGAAGEGFSG